MLPNTRGRQRSTIWRHTLCIACIVLPVLGSVAASASGAGLSLSILDGWIHIGDGPNAEFVPFGGLDAAGTSWSTTFNVSSPLTNAALTLTTYDANWNNPIYVNGSRVGYAPSVPGDWNLVEGTVSIPASLIHSGTNTIKLESEFRINNYDDFGFGSITLNAPAPQQPQPQPPERQPAPGNGQTKTWTAGQLVKFQGDGSVINLDPTSFDNTKKTYVLSHGHNDDPNGMRNIAAAIHDADPTANVIGWDWHETAEQRGLQVLDFMRTARDAFNVQGFALAQKLEEMDIAGYNLILIGHSNGGYVTAAAAKAFASSAMPAGGPRGPVAREVILDTPSLIGTPGLGDNIWPQSALHLDNFYEPDTWSKPIEGANVFNAQLNGYDADGRYLSPIALFPPDSPQHQYIRTDWYPDAVSGGITIDSNPVDVLTHNYVESYEEGATNTFVPLPGTIPGQTYGSVLLHDDMSDLSGYSGVHAQAVLLTVAGQLPKAAAAIGTGSDGFLYRTLTLPQDAFGLSFDAISVGDDGDQLVVSFGDDVLFAGPAAIFASSDWVNSGTLYIGDHAGQTDTLQFWLRSAGESVGEQLYIGNITITAVPDPFTLSLLSLGGLALIRRKRK